MFTTGSAAPRNSSFSGPLNNCRRRAGSDTAAVAGDSGSGAAGQKPGTGDGSADGKTGLATVAADAAGSGQDSGSDDLGGDWRCEAVSFGAAFSAVCRGGAAGAVQRWKDLAGIDDEGL